PADLAATISAVDIVKTVVAELGGKGGGGRPEMAQGGAKDVANAEAAIAAAENVLKG
ncbi:DHHA1 domain-containing protein, partial [Sulfitobacter pontiacus]|uniref:DHHA1 domain-containing protein n=2 Tax=Sulfitobacter TaxID=60136 RepID=UPI00126865A7